MKEKIKTISKYVMNILAFINAILVGLSPIWGWNLDKITDSIVVLVGLIGAYLVSGKIFGDKEEVQTNFNTEDLESIDTEGE
jgi:hypothetical protein